MRRDGFVFYRSFYEAIDKLDDESQLKLYQKVARYSLNGEEEKSTEIVEAIFCLIKPQIDANNKRYKNAKKGGRPKSNQTKTKVKPNQNQTETKKKPKENQTETKVYPKVKEKEKEKDIYINIRPKVEYGSKDVNRLIQGLNKNLGYSLPQDNRARFVASNMLKLLTKNNSRGQPKKGREFMDDDLWQNVNWWAGDYLEQYVEHGYGAKSWYKLQEHLKLWIANNGEYPK